MYSTNNEGKFVVAERFIRTLENKIYITSVSKNVYTHKLDKIVNKYNHTSHSTIKMKPVDVKSSTYIDFDKKNNKEDPKFKVGDHARISKYKNIFAKGYIPNWSEEVFIITKVKNTLPWTYFISDRKGGELLRMFYEKELQKTNQKEFRIEKIIKRKSDKLYVKWKGYDNSFNSWIDKKDIAITKMSCFPPYGYSKNKTEVEFVTSKYATKSDLKNVTGVDKSKITLRIRG